MRACLNLLCMLLLLCMFHVLISISYRCVLSAVAATLQMLPPLLVVHHPPTAELSRIKLLV